MKPARHTHGNRCACTRPSKCATPKSTNVPPPDARRARQRAVARADLLAPAGRRPRRVLRRSLFSFATGATHYPYLRTLVRCHAPSSSFSGSARCGDADVVLKRGARLGGWATFAVVVGNVLCVLLWAPRIDSSDGAIPL